MMVLRRHWPHAEEGCSPEVYRRENNTRPDKADGTMGGVLQLHARENIVSDVSLDAVECLPVLDKLDEYIYDVYKVITESVSMCGCFTDWIWSCQGVTNKYYKHYISLPENNLCMGVSGIQKCDITFAR